MPVTSFEHGSCHHLEKNPQFSSSDGVWSTEGCILDESQSNENLSVCRCNHLTHFAVLMQIDKHQVN